LRTRRSNCELCDAKPQLLPESQDFYEAWLKDHQQLPDELQVIDRLLDLDQLLLEFAAPAFSKIGAPARRVAKLLRALLLLNIKNVRSEKFLVDTELKHNLLYRWFVRLEKNETTNASFRIGLVRLRARLALRLKHEQWQAFLAKTVEQALVEHRRLLAAAEAKADQAPQAATEEIAAALVSSSPDAESTPAAAARERPDTVPPQVGKVTFDLTPVKARARILDKRDLPKANGQEGLSADKQRAHKPAPKKPAARKKIPPRSQGDLDAYWITKKRRGPQGRLTETTLGYEAGLFSTQSQGIITGVVVREASQANRTEFPNWVDQYAQDWGLGDSQLELSADGEFHTGGNLKHFEDRKWRLHVPISEPTVPKGKLDHRYFSYLAAEDIFVCHEGAELKRIGHDKQKQRTRYRAPVEACANCQTANLCKGGEGPRKVSRSDFAEQFARAKEQAKTDQHRDARWAQHVYGEGSFAHSNCNHGLDRARYYGQKRMLLQAYWTAAAMNLKKAFRFLQARLEASGPSTDPVPT
jgi:Transposase DDE domain